MNLSPKEVLAQKYTIQHLDLWGLKSIRKEISTLVNNPVGGSNLAKVDLICVEYTLKSLDKIIERVEEGKQK